MISYEEYIKNINVLLVDDDLDYINVTYLYLKTRGYQVDTATNGDEALEKIKQKDYHILLVDYFMPSMSGEELINQIRQNNKEMVIILQTGFSGQKPPVESMEKLNIQNYHDKTEGIDRLNLELISAVKTFIQQNEIELTKYRSNAIGNLITSVATEIRSTLLSISAGIEYTNMVLKESEDTPIDSEALEKINKFSQNNKEYLEKIDKILTSIIKQSNTEKNEDVISDKDTIETIELILKNLLRTKNIILNTKVILRANTYLVGQIDDVIFIICELIRKIIDKCNPDDKIDLTLSEDESNWYYKIKNNNVANIEKKDLFLIRNIVFSIKDISMIEEQDSICLEVKKVQA